MPTKGLNKCVLNEEYQSRLKEIREKILEVNNLVRECGEHLHYGEVNNISCCLNDALKSLNYTEEYYGM